MWSLARIGLVGVDPGAARSWSVIANDGIIATAGILEGFAGAGASDRTLWLAAVTATVVGVLGVGGAEWAEAAAAREAQLAVAEREAQLAVAEREAREIEVDPGQEYDELTAHYEAKGLTPDLARQVAEQLMQRNALEAQLESEFGIVEILSVADTVWTGIGAGLAYGAGAAIPLLITLLFPVGVETWAILAAVLVSLMVTSYVGARSGGMHLSRTVVRTLAVGFMTMAVSYWVGRAVG